MRIVIALGGNALLRRGDPMTIEVQRRNVRIAAEAITPLAAEHSIVVVHGNGPQVGLLSLQAEAYKGATPYPLDVLDAGTQGMIGYLIQQELRALLPPERQVATLLTMITVNPDDPAFSRPSKFVGPVYAKDAADALAARKGWAFRPDGPAWRRVVPSPQPRQILEIEPIRWLLERQAVVICAGGGGIPTLYPSEYPPVRDIVSSVALTFFAFLGFGIITFTAKDLAKPSRQLPRAMYLALGIATVIYVEAAACMVLAVVFKLDAIASIGSAVALVIFTLITAAHLRIRAQTGASLPILILAIVAAGAVFVTFVFTTLIHEPASIVTLAGILLLSVALDLGWKHHHATRTRSIQLVQ